MLSPDSPNKFRRVEIKGLRGIFAAQARWSGAVRIGTASGYWAFAQTRVDWRSIKPAAAQIGSPPRASPNPTQHVENQPYPAAMAAPPSQGPSALAVLNAE